MTAAALAPMRPAQASGTGAITGIAYADVDRDAHVDPDEPRFANHQLYLYTASGTYVANVSTDAEGSYRFPNLADGDYRVQYTSPSWWGLRGEWVPTTTGTLFPRTSVAVREGAAVTTDFGWRRIVRSSDVSAPLSSAHTINGVRIDSYNDAVPASDLAAAVNRGLLLGAEGPATTVRFDLSSGSSAATSAAQDGSGRYVSFAATVSVTYLSWLDNGDRTLFHELGHAWSQYYGYLVQQDPEFSGYLRARGLTGDSRLGSSYAWQPDEMIAEDYRQLFGSPTASGGGQANTEVPSAREVDGLRDYLSGPFRSTTAPESSESGGASVPVVSTPLMSPTPVTTAGSATVTVDGAATVKLAIFDGKGALVRVLKVVDTSGPATVTAEWNRTNSAGRRVKAGSYTLRAEASSAAGVTATSSSFRVA